MTWVKCFYCYVKWPCVIFLLVGYQFVNMYFLLFSGIVKIIEGGAEKCYSCGELEKDA